MYLLATGRGFGASRVDEQVSLMGGERFRMCSVRMVRLRMLTIRERVFPYGPADSRVVEVF